MTPTPDTMGKMYRIQIAPNTTGTFSRPDPSPETIRILKEVIRMAMEKEDHGMIACPRCTPPTDPMCPYCDGTGEIPMHPHQHLTPCRKSN